MQFFSFSSFKKTSCAGQAVLVVLLVMSVLLTLGLSAISRSVSDVRISEQSQESARAYWAAQAGLEKAILGQGGNSGTIQDVNYTVTKSILGGTPDFIFPEKLAQNKVFSYWLVEHNATTGEIDAGSYYSGNSVIVYWGDGTETPAMIATLIYLDTTGTFRSKKFAFDPVSGRTIPSNFASSETGTSLAGIEFKHKATLVISTLPAYAKPYLLTIKLLFNTTPQPVGISTTGLGFSQGTCYESEATVESSNVVRKLRECRTWVSNPEIFNYLLFSGGSLVK